MNLMRMKDICQKNIYFFLGAAFLAAGFLAAGFLAAFLAAGFLAAFLAAGFLAAFLALGFLALGFLAAFFFLGFFAFLGFLAFFFLGFLALTATSLYLPAPFPEALAFLRVPLASPRLRARRTWTAALAASTLLLATTCLRMA